MTFWNAHYRYHRRYGIEDVFTRVMTMAIIVLVLFFVYPLKFLFTMLTVNIFELHMHDAPQVDSAAEADTLYTDLRVRFRGRVEPVRPALWHACAQARRARAVRGREAAHARRSRANAIYVCVCLLSVALASRWTTAPSPA
jgi:hypothetical protein